MSKVRVAFLGTPEFAVTSLKGLLDDEHFEVVGVVTQPDRPAGRKMVLTPSPVKNLAMSRGLKVISPESVNRDVILDEIRLWGAEIAVVVAFGQILSQNFLNSFKFGAVNVHGSILPQWRGAAPVQRGLEAGDAEGGVTLQKIVKELDAGDIIGVRRLALDSEINAIELFEKLAVLGADLLHVELMDHLRGNLAAIPQNHSDATFAKKINKMESELRWSEPAMTLHNRVRAFVAGPGTWVPLQGKKLKVHRTRVISSSGSGAVGTIVGTAADGFDIQTGSGVLRLLEIQPESRNRMSAAEFFKTAGAQMGLKQGAKFE